MNEARPNINVTPLIDVLLVLLIIFMVVSPLKPSDFKAKIPQPPSTNESIEPHTHTLIVAVNSDYALSLNNEEITGDIENSLALTEKLSEIFRERENNHAFDESGVKIQKTVFIKAPKNLSYGKVVSLVDAVKSAGAEPISLQIDDLD